jgi:hypothetical protein
VKKTKAIVEEIKQNVKKRLASNWHKPHIMKMLNRRLKDLIKEVKKEEQVRVINAVIKAERDFRKNRK